MKASRHQKGRELLPSFFSNVNYHRVGEREVVTLAPGTFWVGGYVIFTLASVPCCLLYASLPLPRVMESVSSFSSVSFLSHQRPTHHRWLEDKQHAFPVSLWIKLLILPLLKQFWFSALSPTVWAVRHPVIRTARLRAPSRERLGTSA